MPIADKLQTVYDGIEDVRDAIQEVDTNLGRGTIDTLGDDIRFLTSGGSGYGVKVYGDVRTETDGDEPGTTDYVYTKTLIFDGGIIAGGEDINTDVIDGIGELDGDIVDLPNGKVQIPLNTGVVLTVDATKTYVLFRDPVVESIVLSNWGVNGKITLEQVRAIKTIGTYFQNTSIGTFNEFKWFTGIVANYKGGENTSYPFRSCTSLSSIKLPRISGIGQGCFDGCSSLSDITIPATFTNLGDANAYSHGFFANTAIEEIVVPDSVVKLSNYAFMNAMNLKHIVWGNNLPFPNEVRADFQGMSFSGDSLLETIDNLPSVFSSCPCNFRNCSKFDFSGILPKLEQSINNNWISNNSYRFDGTRVFDYAPQGIVTFANITSNASNLTCTYMFNSDSENGFVASFPNWTVNPSFQYFTKVGTVMLSSSVTSIGDFSKGCDAAEYILPCTTIPTLTSIPTLSSEERILVPASSLAAYQADSEWGQVASHLRAYADPATASFCTVPDEAPVPQEYTRVEYIRNYDNNGIPMNTQISNLGYSMKVRSQMLFDFSHEWYQDIATSGTYERLFSCGGNYMDFVITINSSDRTPGIYRRTSTSENYPNPMGLNLHQKWYFNSNVTGEAFGKRSTLKFSRKFMEYHGLVHQVDEVTGDSTSNLSFLRYNDNYGIRGRKLKIYRLCIFEPVENASDYDDISQYEIVRDYVPVMRNSDKKCGLYERIGGTFYLSTVDSAQFLGPLYE